MRGFLRVTPDPLIAGGTGKVFAYYLDSGSEIAIAGVTVSVDGIEVGPTDPNGEITFTVPGHN